MKFTQKELKQQKAELKKKFDEVYKKLCDNPNVESSDIDLLCSLKGQLDVEPTRIIVEEKDVIKEYDMGAFRFIRAKSHIIFQDKGGMTLMVSPRMTALYEHLDNLLSLKDDFKNLDEELKKAYDTLLTSTVYVLNLPIYATCDDRLFLGHSKYIIRRLSRYVDRLQKTELKEETYNENAEFENINDAFEETLKEDVK